jgi:flagellar basal body rod protein FlgC
MVNLMEAGRAYEANVTALNAQKELYRAALGIGRG